MAGLVGSINGRDKLFWNRQKSFQGLMAFFLGAYIATQVIIMFFLIVGWLRFEPAYWSVVLAGVVFLTGFVESFNWGAWDNIAVYLTAFLSLRYFGY